MTISHTRILVVGATQGTGLHVVNLLQQHGTQVRVLARNIEKARTVFAAHPVQIHHGDVTQPATFTGAFDDITGIIYTLGVTQRPASEALIKSTEHDGTLNFLRAAVAAGFRGPFVYMTSMGTEKPSLAGWLLNTIKGNTLKWRAKVEAAVQQGGLPYTIVRAGVLTDAPAMQHTLTMTQTPMGASLTRKISRADVARVLVSALYDPTAANIAFNLFWGEATTTPA